ncbi:MAG: sigma-54 dependent transcriptional regulator [Paludibacteraceae bacterium]|nr:sigma-54 dependent transcriptional regulator [Paludibacteraceae bacterium]
MTRDDIQTIKQRFGIIGLSPLLSRDIDIAVQVAKTDLSVMVIGESGSGKEFFPQIIHAYSSRKHGPYFVVNCGAIPEGTIDSELFGHEKGAYTDAIKDRKGYFEIANGGTLFLDEVGELPLSMQAKLLRVLETGEFVKMGASAVQKTDVRVVAATNVNLPAAIKAGKFREDLYYRLNTVEIKVPALRERKDDIPLLFRKFAVEFSEKYRMPPIRLSDEANELLKSYYWRGNVRQLKNIVQQISIMESDRDISADRLRLYLPQDETEKGLSLASASQGDTFMNERELLYKVLFDMKHEINDLREQIRTMHHNEEHSVGHKEIQNITHDTLHKDDDFQLAEEVEEEPNTTNAPSHPTSLDEMEKEAIRSALVRNKNNRKKTAAELKFSERTLYRKIKQYDLE